MTLFARKFLACLGAAGVIAGCGGGAVYSPRGDVVQVSGGAIAAAGDSSATLRAFKGIPFAAPPVGALRWKAPQPVQAWSGARAGDSFGAACVQGNRPAGQPGSILYQDPGPQSEDCLFLNVWTGTAQGAREKRPVMLLLYGGGYQLGAASQTNYDGRGLASKGAVVVTMNYRVGALGFLAHPALSVEAGRSGNYALLDALAGLQWVQDNIAAFGGDAARVTVYSESAGAGLASVLLASPKAKGLFHRMVLGSLGVMPAGADTPTLAQAEAAGSAFGKALGAQTLDVLRQKSAKDIMAATFASGPIVDGDVLPDQMDRLFTRREFNDVPLMLGWNADEGTPYPAFATTVAGYEATAAARYGGLAPAFKAAYPVTNDADVQAMAYAPMRDGQFAWQPWTLARAHAAQGKAPTYLYFFTRRPDYHAGQRFNEQDPPTNFGAYHSLEQVYLYNNLDRSAPPRPYTPLDRQIADVASSYLVNFAASGNPNASGLPQWPEFTGPTSQTMEIGDTIAPRAVFSRAGLDFFDGFHTQSLGRPLPF
ncbi:carboxylesterase family protein [Acidovorax sp. CCYZU-2555]|uniref:carboxylesterase/lipase family protein n=1 Tax=Acidovorax sp. CCYZU-2555 TaxID=2835042 RepID=UPI001BCAB27F|nr:carboxylesterase family protein [Acidovorax sp. CCYZU-2555]MBS7781382.1 carboxylesterase family protein [Acidovorax sp. CCYZU-2555]